MDEGQFTTWLSTAATSFAAVAGAMAALMPARRKLLWSVAGIFFAVGIYSSYRAYLALGADAPSPTITALAVTLAVAAFALLWLGGRLSARLLQLIKRRRWKKKWGDLYAITSVVDRSRKEPLIIAGSKIQPDDLPENTLIDQIARGSIGTQEDLDRVAAARLKRRP